MATPDDIEAAVAESVEEGVDSVSVDGLSAKQTPLKERLDALDRLRGNAGAKKNHRGIRFSVLSPPGGGGHP